MAARGALVAFAFLFPWSGCLFGVAGQEGCPSAMVGDTRNQAAHLRICDYAFEVNDRADTIRVMEVGRAPPGWRQPYLSWSDLALESLDARLRVDLNEPATNRTPHGIEARRIYPLGFLSTAPVAAGDVLYVCDATAGEQPVRFMFYQYAKDHYYGGGGRVEVLWTDVADCA